MKRTILTLVVAALLGVGVAVAAEAIGRAMSELVPLPPPHDPLA